MYSFHCQTQQRLKEICSVKQQPQVLPQKSNKQDVLQKHHLIWRYDRSIDLCVLQDAYHKLFCIFGDFYAPGVQETEV